MTITERKKQMKTLVGGLALVALVVMADGCRMTKICDSTGGMEVTQSEGCKAEVRADDPCFREWLDVESAVAVRATSGFLTAQVELRNVHKDVDDNGREDDFDAQCRVEWFDANGLALRPGQDSWYRMTWHGGQSLPIKAVAPAPEAVRYVLRLRHVR